jgi:Tfp pilus assembly protein PilF
MPVALQNAVRRVVPRWNSFRDALNNGELEPVTLAEKKVADSELFLLNKEEQWQEDKSLFVALDLLSASFVLGDSRFAKEAAEFVLQHEPEVTPAALRIANAILGRGVKSDPEPGVTSSDFRAAIRQAKARRVREPRNAFAWAELARLYAINGMRDLAERPMRIALSLAPGNRHILRCAARYFLHAGDPGEALSILRHAEGVQSDPWLLAAEVAVSSVTGKTSRFMRGARALAGEKNIKSFHRSELAAAVASAEMWAGSEKKARNLFVDALEGPTENAFAQVVWASQQVGLREFPFERVHVPNDFEARALEARNNAHWETAVAHCREWAVLESFSSRPYGLASAVAAELLRRPADAVSLVNEGLKTNPHHPGLINNKAFALVGCGKPKDAMAELLGADLKQANDDSKVCILATAGLVEFRLGNATDGRELYQRAITYAHQMGNRTLKATAQVYLAREEARVGHAGYEQFFEAGAEYLEQAQDAYGKELVKLLRADIANFAAAGSNKGDEKSPAGGANS